MGRECTGQRRTACAIVRGMEIVPISSPRQSESAGVQGMAPRTYAAANRSMAQAKVASDPNLLEQYLAEWIGSVLGEKLRHGTPTHPYSPLRTPTHPYSPLLTPTHPYSPLLIPTHPCSPLRAVATWCNQYCLSGTALTRRQSRTAMAFGPV